jgi:hypothetical protein
MSLGARLTINKSIGAIVDYHNSSWYHLFTLLSHDSSTGLKSIGHRAKHMLGEPRVKKHPTLRDVTIASSISDVSHARWRLDLHDLRMAPVILPEETELTRIILAPLYEMRYYCL